MKSLIRDNPLGIILLSTAGILLLLVLALPFLSGGVPKDKTIPVPTEGQTEYEALQISKLEPIEEFAVIKQRPLFNDDRKPVIVLSDELGEGDMLLDIEPVGPLKAKLTGVIITKEQRIAMLLDQGSNITVSAAEGESLDGDLSGWSVEKVEARNVSLINQQGEVADLELVMFTQSLGNAPDKPSRANKQRASNAGNKNTKAGANGAQKAAKSGNKSAETKKSDPKPMTAAEFMRRGLEKREAARKQRESEKKSDGSH